VKKERGPSGVVENGEWGGRRGVGKMCWKTRSLRSLRCGQGEDKGGGGGPGGGDRGGSPIRCF